VHACYLFIYCIVNVNVAYANLRVANSAETFANADANLKSLCDQYKSAIHSNFPVNIAVNINPTVSDDDLRKRIELLKQRPAKTAKTLKQFVYDPDQPLQLPYKE
jgi:hypothetical protein